MRRGNSKNRVVAESDDFEVKIKSFLVTSKKKLSRKSEVNAEKGIS
jgi:hypothetical protein